jgi:hypothetical protein
MHEPREIPFIARPVAEDAHGNDLANFAEEIEKRGGVTVLVEDGAAGIAAVWARDR